MKNIRNLLVDHRTRSVRLAILEGSDESLDPNTTINCDGLGRIRRYAGQSMILNSGRGIVPRRRLFRTLPPGSGYTTQCFQLAGCNWRCWYCFVDDALLTANPMRSRFVPVADMVSAFLAMPDGGSVLDLSGGQPELVPEWTLWTMQDLEATGLRGQVHVWVDDNLSGRFLERYCTSEEIEYMASFPKHTRAGCFKGMDDISIKAATGSRGASVTQQLRACEALIDWGFDVYFYLTTLGPFRDGPKEAARQFVNRLIGVHPLLPLRVIPLEIRNHRALLTRVGTSREGERLNQIEGLIAWEEQLAESFTPEQLATPYESIHLT
mgnify:CR=1 FL=1